MLRVDGCFSFYRIQHLVGTLPHRMGKVYRAGDKTWSYSNFDTLGYPSDAFNTLGDCWQKLGVFGTFNFTHVEPALEVMSRKNPGVEFRVVRVNVMQQTMVLP